MPIRQVPPTPRQRSSKGRKIRWISLGALAVVALFVVLGVSLNKSSRAETAAAPAPLTTPLGCAVHTTVSGTQVDDISCIELALIERVCGITPTNWTQRSIYPGGHLADQWYAPGQLLGAQFIYTFDVNRRVASVLFACGAAPARTITANEWWTMITPGVPTALPYWVR
ncbi:MAG: hypothetical protein AB7L91_14345 [Dehalococcoidia bacterium]